MRQKKTNSILKKQQKKEKKYVGEIIVNPHGTIISPWWEPKFIDHILHNLGIPKSSSLRFPYCG